MKVGKLKGEADRLAAEAWTERRAYQGHAHRAIAIGRRRIGSTAGLAISFSLGFVTGSVVVDSHDARSGTAAKAGRTSGRTSRGITQQLLHGPIGEAAIKLASAIVASSLMKYMARADEMQAASTATPSEATLH